MKQIALLVLAVAIASIALYNVQTPETAPALQKEPIDYFNRAE
jgi:hypothetical protein